MSRRYEVDKEGWGDLEGRSILVTLGLGASGERCLWSPGSLNRGKLLAHRRYK